MKEQLKMMEYVMKMMKNVMKMTKGHTLWLHPGRKQDSFLTKNRVPTQIRPCK
jgi:hypothetical protein